MTDTLDTTLDNHAASHGTNHGAAAPVLLPETAFPARRDPVAEAALVADWQTRALHRRVHDACAGRPRWVLHDGPPYANGDIHMGHAVDKLFKDMLVRARRMAGYDAVLVPGWDCHGLPIEWAVEDEMRGQGRQRRDIDPAAFRAACRARAEHWVARQADGFRRLGVLADWDHPYLTMSAEAEAAMVAELHRLLADGRVFRARRPVLWSVPEATALADAEVVYKPAPYRSLTFRMAVAAHEGCPDLAGADLLVWTTTPWTLPANRAVAAAADADYHLLPLSDGSRVLVAAAVADAVVAQTGLAAGLPLMTLTGAALAGAVLRHPLAALGYGPTVPLLTAGFVETTAGTGFVHVAPGLGPDDHRLGLGHDLPVDVIMEADGHYCAGLPAFGGAVVIDERGLPGDADDRVIRALTDLGRVAHLGQGVHDAAHSWRSGAPLVWRATDQWYLAIDDDLRARARAALERVAFLPPETRNRMLAMLDGRPDWCISRQRAWGAPIALFVHRRTGAVLDDPAVLARSRDLILAGGAEAWFAADPAEVLGADLPEGGHDPADWLRVDDVLDVWFESGCTHGWVVEGRFGLGTIADLCSEGSDQHRGWFQSSLIEAVATRGHAPFRALRTHGFVLDDAGRKMSKSAGNGVSPLDAADAWGADVLRLWVAASDTARDVRFAPETMRLHAETLRRIRNTLRWMLGNLAAAPAGLVPPADRLERPERLLLSRLAEIDGALRDDLDATDPAAMLDRLVRFCTDDLSAGWFAVRKDVLYCDAATSPRRRAVAAVLARVFNHLVAWIAPILPFAAEEAWRARWGDGAGSVHERLWPAVDPLWLDPGSILANRHLDGLRATVRAAAEPARRAGQIGRLDHAALTLHLPGAMAADLTTAELRLLLGVATLTVHRDAGDGQPRVVGLERSTRPVCRRCRQPVAVLVAPRDLCPRCDAVG
ncbi:isoleucine--tRNA ligase [Tistrella bauzanensis]|uniref:isoleucine--tRNA ligase n=1 Tax=Tistrella TaxID=171436 RepID=UPI0031F6D5D8